jgi:hypothetical protein
MSKALKYTFLIHAIIALLIGAPLLLAPGRILGVFGWEPVDPLLSRLLGAALLAFAWGSWHGWRATDRAQVNTLLEMETVFTVLGSAGLLRHLLIAGYPWYVWTIFGILALFAVAWIFFLFKK